MFNHVRRIIPKAVLTPQIMETLTRNVIVPINVLEMVFLRVCNRYERINNVIIKP